MLMNMRNNWFTHIFSLASVDQLVYGSEFDRIELCRIEWNRHTIELIKIVSNHIVLLLNVEHLITNIYNSKSFDLSRSQAGQQLN